MQWGGQSMTRRRILITDFHQSGEANILEKENRYEYLRSQVKPALQSKLEEFRLLGYQEISEPQLWEFLLKKKWKKATEEIKLHEVIQDIFSVKVSDYMHYATVEAYKAPEFSMDSEEDMRELLK
jgi:hypothetical protein